MKEFAALLRKDNQPVRYLVVDDSVFARKNLIKMIEMFGGEVAGEAGDGLTAIAEFNRTSPDIVLMDITMPQMEGIEAVERIVRQHASARIVMVSSVGYQENILAALQKGAKHFVQHLRLHRLLHEVLRAFLERRQNVFLVPDRRDHDDARAGVLPHDALHRLDPFHLRHGDVHEHDVRTTPVEFRDGRQAISGFAGHFAAEHLDHFDQILAREDGIVHHQVANRLIVFAK